MKTMVIKTLRRGKRAGLFLKSMVLVLVCLYMQACSLPWDELSLPIFAGGNGDEDAKCELLMPSEDAGQTYVDCTFFVGDSNTLRMVNYGLVRQQQCFAREGMGIGGALEATVAWQGSNAGRYTLRQALGLASPDYVLITLGTNDIGSLDTQAIAEKYRILVDAVRQEVPNAQIVVNTVPPVTDGCSYAKLTMADIEACNAALRQMCKEEEIAFLNSTEALVGENGHCADQYAIADGLHLSEEGLCAMLEYYRTHALP